MKNLPALALCMLVVACSRQADAPPPAPPEVSVLKLAPRAATVTEEYVGETEAVNAVEIRPRVGGVLEQQAVPEGERISKGQLLFTIDRQPFVAALAQAKAALAQAQANATQSERDLARMRQLSKQEVVSQQQLDAAVARQEADRAAVAAAKAAVRTAELNLGYTSLTSPIDGVVSRALVRLGGLVTAYSTLLTTVYETDPMYVNFSISEQRLLLLQKQLGRAPDQHSATAPPFQLVLADGSLYPHEAKLNFIDAVVDKATGTLSMRLAVANPDQLLRPNQFVRVRVAVQQAEAALLIPQRAVQQLQGKNYVWIVDGENKAQQQDVDMGGRVGSDWVVQKGLKAGDTIVVDGVQRLKPGVEVNAKPLAAAGGGGGAGAPK